MSTIQKKSKTTNFGLNLKFLRKLKGYSQTKLAQELNLTRNNIASYESGLVEPNTLIFLRVCDYFQRDTREMLVTVVSERTTEQLKIKDEKLSGLNDRLTEFISQTNEMSKVLEGYQAFFELRKTSEVFQSHPALVNTLDDLLIVLKSVISSNWKLIRSFLPNDDEE